MRVQTRHANFVVPPTTALYLPAHEDHSVTMDGAVAMRELFIDDEVAKRLGADPKVIAVSNLFGAAIQKRDGGDVPAMATAGTFDRSAACIDDGIDPDESRIDCRLQQRTGL